LSLYCISHQQKFYYRDPHVDLSNNFVFDIHLKQEELNSLAEVDYDQVIKCKLLAAKELYLLQKDSLKEDLENLLLRPVNVDGVKFYHGTIDFEIKDIKDINPLFRETSNSK
jgi:hypothetical protein